MHKTRYSSGAGTPGVRVDIDFDTLAQTRVNDALAALEASFERLIALTPQQRKQLTKMGDKSEAFCRQAAHVFTEYPDILPRNFDLPGYQRDVRALDVLRPWVIRLGKIYQRITDTDMAIGSDLMTNGLEGYAVFKVSGKGQGLDEARRALSVRFTRVGKTETTPPEVEEPGA